MAETFEQFIESLLRRAKLSKQVMGFLLSPESMRKFNVAFTHKSITTNAYDNYELAELVGDSIINTIIIAYIRSRFPKIVNVDWISRLKNKTVSKENLAILAEKYGFLKWIRMEDHGSEEDDKAGLKDRGHANTLIYGSRLSPQDPKSVVLRRSIPTQKGVEGVNWVRIDWVPEIPKNVAQEKMFINAKFMSLLEDTMEAFVGTLQTLIDTYEGARHPDYAIRGLLPGPGYAVCATIVSSFLDEIKFSLKYEDVFDPISRLKQRVFDRPPMQWRAQPSVRQQVLGFGTLLRSNEIIGGTQIMYETRIHAPIWWKGRDRLLVAVVRGEAQKGSRGTEMIAAQLALDVIAGDKPLPVDAEVPDELRGNRLPSNLWFRPKPLDPYTTKQSSTM